MRDREIRYTVVIPAYNEEGGLAQVLRDLCAVLDDQFEILVIDDGSADRTRQVAEEAGVRVLSHRMNQGKGAALRTGIRHAKGACILFIDADGTYPAEAIPRIVERLETHAMVVARRRDQENIHVINRIGNALFRYLLRRLYRSCVVDPLSGLYGVKKEDLLRMDLTSRGFEIETEITIKAAQMGLTVDQVDIPYHPRIGVSKLKPLKDGWRILRTIGMLMFLYNPTTVLIVPGLVLFLGSFLLMVALLFGNLAIGRVYLSYHAAIFASLMAIMGCQMAVFGAASRMYAVLHKYARPDWTTRLLSRRSSVLLLIGVALTSMVTAILLGLHIFWVWVESGFSPIFRLKEAVFMFFLFSFGIQMVFSTVFLSIFSGEIRRLEFDRHSSVY